MLFADTGFEGVAAAVPARLGDAPQAGEGARRQWHQNSCKHHGLVSPIHHQQLLAAPVNPNVMDLWMRGPKSSLGIFVLASLNFDQNWCVN